CTDQGRTFLVGTPCAQGLPRNRCNRRPNMLSRFIAVSTLSMVAIAGVRYYGNASASPQGQQAVFPADPPAAMDECERERYEQLQDRARRRGVYAQLAAKLTHELEAGTMLLSDATERTFYFCLQNYPEHLEFVTF